MNKFKCPSCGSKTRKLHVSDPDDREYFVERIMNSRYDRCENCLNLFQFPSPTIDETNNFLGKMKAKKLNYISLINSCDIGLSTVMLSADICKKIKFQSISTKEDYVYWLTLAKLLPTLNGYSKTVTVYRKRHNSLSSSLPLKLINAFRVYYKYEKFNLYYSIYSVIRLSFRYILKQRNLNKDQ